MNFEEFKSNIKKEFKNFDISFFNKILIYKKILQNYNKTTNLTKLDNEEKIFGDYFYESLIPYKNADLKNVKTLLDIGTGSGIPGIPIILLYPHIKLTVIESNNKKINFLKILVKNLNINNINILHKRAECVEKNEYNHFDVVTSRAVAKLNKIVPLSEPYCKKGGVIIEPKSIKINEELKDIKKNKLSNLYLDHIETFVSFQNKIHNVVYIVKK
ncbi:MAG: 16S rRNA (guanine(527)-N(7))-methyltransferase RsmG [Mycoplasmataceae bacterium]|jgi:16S rRNA (guanine527-N7)-methyltransferase|nr:16S rRNA (guanine(527)-N(7))-methyltransferase RsmG [Mycoplasmataceae bacterium]